MKFRSLTPEQTASGQNLLRRAKLLKSTVKLAHDLAIMASDDSLNEGLEITRGGRRKDPKRISLYIDEGDLKRSKLIPAQADGALLEIEEDTCFLTLRVPTDDPEKPSLQMSRLSLAPNKSRPSFTFEKPDGTRYILKTNPKTGKVSGLQAFSATKNDHINKMSANEVGLEMSVALQTFAPVVNRLHDELI